MKSNEEWFPYSVSMTEQIYLKLKDLIVKEQLIPGQKLGHEDLSKILNVSHTPIREALNRLVQEGFVSKVLRRGYYLNEIKVDEAEELYIFRETIEQYTIENAITSKDTTLERDLMAIMKKYQCEIQKGMSVERRQVDREFHLRITEASGNRFVKKTLEQIFDRLILKRRLEGFIQRGKEVYEEHEILLECLRKKDRGKAKETMRNHIRKGMENFLKHYRPKQP